MNIMKLSRKERIIKAIEFSKVPFDYINHYDSDAGYFEYIGKKPIGFFSFLKQPEIIAYLNFEPDRGEYWITNNMSLYDALEKFGFECEFQTHI